MLNNLGLMIEKCKDPYGLLKNKHVSEMINKMLSANYYQRPNIEEIFKSDLVQKKTQNHTDNDKQIKD